MTFKKKQLIQDQLLQAARSKPVNCPVPGTNSDDAYTKLPPQRLVPKPTGGWVLIPKSPLYVRAILVSSNGSEWSVGTQWHGYFRSNDGGRTWDSGSGRELDSYTVSALVSGPKGIFAGLDPGSSSDKCRLAPIQYFARGKNAWRSWEFPCTAVTALAVKGDVLIAGTIGGVLTLSLRPESKDIVRFGLVSRRIYSVGAGKSIVAGVGWADKTPKAKTRYSAFKREDVQQTVGQYPSSEPAWMELDEGLGEMQATGASITAMTLGPDATLYAGTSKGTLIYLDDASTPRWVAINAPQNAGRIDALKVANGKLFVAARNGGVSYFDLSARDSASKRDLTKAWHPLPGLPKSQVHALEIAGKNLLVGTQEGIYRREVQ